MAKLIPMGVLRVGRGIWAKMVGPGEEPTKHTISKITENDEKIIGLSNQFSAYHPKVLEALHVYR